jgi:capsular polysaccharide biosynthesis protein
VSVLAGVAVAVGIAVIGAVVISGRTPEWTAHASLVVLPSNAVGETAEASYYETLSRGQIVATVADLIDRQPDVPVDGQGKQLSPVAADAVNIAVEVVPSTAIVTIQVTAPDKAWAVGTADAVAQASSFVVSDLNVPYDATLVSDAAGTERQEGPSTLTLLGVVLVVALIAGFAVQQGLFVLGTRARTVRNAGAAEHAEPVPAVAPEAEAPDPAPRETRTRARARAGAGNRQERAAKGSSED